MGAIITDKTICDEKPGGRYISMTSAEELAIVLSVLRPWLSMLTAVRRRIRVLWDDDRILSPPKNDLSLLENP